MRGKRKWSYGDWTLPGYNYLGPGNSLDKGKPTNENDAAAFRHDVEYDEIENLGFDPYTMWSEADQRLLDNTNWKDYGGVIAKLLYHSKKQLHRLQLVGEVPKKQRLRGGFGEQYAQTKADADLVSSLSNLQDGGDMSKNSTPIGSGNEAGLAETPIDRVTHVSRGPADHQFASLPYIRDLLQSHTSWSRDLAFRMTSPYDPAMTNAGSTDLNAGTGSAIAIPPVSLDSADTSITSARWYDYYASQYNYYHVVSARWHCTIENLKTDPLWVHWMYYSDEIPPIAATNEDMLNWKDCHSHYLGPAASAVSNTGTISTNERIVGFSNVEGNGAASGTNYTAGDMVQSIGPKSVLTLSGSYKPGQFQRQIRQDADVENWTAVNANPALPERLLFRFKAPWDGLDTNDSAVYDRLVKYRLYFRVEYLVEFKELIPALRWPVERQPAFVTSSTNIEEDEE